MNIKTPTKQNCLQQNKKQLIMMKILQRQIKDQDYLMKVYTSQIQALQQKKKGLSNRLLDFESFNSNYSYLQKWDAGGYQHIEKMKNSKNGMGKTINKNTSLMGQSAFISEHSINQSPNIKKLNSSPIRRLQSSKINNNRSIRLENKLSNPLSPSDKKYSKIEQILRQITQINSRINNKSQKIIKNRQQDEISANLLLKIQEQQKITQNQIKKWKQLENNKKIKSWLHQKIMKVKQDIFKQNQGLLVIKTQNVNKNKQIIAKGYTSRMFDVIASYGGTRRE